MGRVNTREMQLTIWESVVGLDQIPFGSQSGLSPGGQFQGWGQRVGQCLSWPRLLHAIDQQQGLPGVCWPDAQRIAASRPFHGAAGDALLALALLLHAPPPPPALPAPPSGRLGAWAWAAWSNWNIRCWRCNRFPLCLGQGHNPKSWPPTPLHTLSARPPIIETYPLYLRAKQKWW